ncbi:FMN-binding protein [Clostridium sp. 'White wine YQ']|uniref:FMN-binding protein n=1 Tax=Clostridium sp. 'White wine YQ' TaxID=3027474 RepID=UPI00236629E0|nr:FMN-binding protein [Clostridium sp. 'White wine YQ']MDD7793612.1 FMN-binding protein [Clostridium sp. 'White wine YQ']
MANLSKKIYKIQIARKIVQIIGLILFPGVFILTFSEIRDIYQGIISGNFSFIQMIGKSVEVITVIPITIFLGRFFCGWLCAFGTLNDFLYLISNKVFKLRFRVNETVDTVLKTIKYLILLFIVYFIWTEKSTLFESSSPWDAFAQLPQFSDAISQYTIGSIILLLIIIGSLFIERFFCRYLCPLGAIFTFTSKLRIFDISKKRDKCGKCRICTNNCSMGIPMYESDKIRSGECINCFKCLDVCPRKNTKAEICGENVSPALAACVAIGGLTVLYAGGNALSKTIENTSITQSQKNNITSSLKTNNQSKKYKDGTYIGTGSGYRPRLQVAVTIKDGKISNIEIGSNNETPRFAARPFNIVPSEIIEAQSTDVDGVSGATRSSNGIKEAVEDALSQAEDTSTTVDTNIQNNNETTNNSSTNDTSSVSNNKNTNSNAQTGGNNSTQNSQSQYKDGVYEGTGRGYRPNLQVSVTIQNGKISSVEIGDNNETPRFAERVFENLPSEIVNAQSTDVDGVSGATRSSNGIKAAVEDALSKAKI